MAEKRRESPAGFHYYSTYLDCARKFYLKYVLGLKYKYTGPALIRGGAMHDAMAVMYTQHYDIDLTLDEYRRCMLERESEYEEKDRFEMDVDWGEKLLRCYWETHAEEDHKRFDIIEVEQEYELWIGPENEFRVTVRPDRILQEKETGHIFPVETKTTSWGIKGMYEKTEASDQITAYLWALSKIHPEWEANRCLIDVLYNRGKVFKCERVGYAMRPRNELVSFEMEMYGTILEISQKVKTLEDIPWPLMFRANRNACKEYGCEYRDLCRINIPPGEYPPMYEKDEWVEALSVELQLQKDFSLKEWNRG